MNARTLFTLALALATSPLLAQQPEPPPTAEAIMARVGTNQDRADADRLHYVYLQHARVLSRKGKTLMCEEITDSRITPSPSGSHAALLKLDGRLLEKHHYLTYTTLPPTKRDAASHAAPVNNDHDLSVHVDSDLDRDLVEDIRSDLTSDTSRDGFGARLFPLTSKSQRDYLFHLIGREQRNGRETFHIEFQPKDKSDFGWKGNAWIDTAAFQPVVVTTSMARKIPFAVRTLLGTSLPGLGFTVVYAPQPDGVWFPISFGTEFKLHVLFFFSREIIIDAQNGHFEKTHVTSTIVDPAAPASPQ